MEMESKMSRDRRRPRAEEEAQVGLVRGTEM